MHIVGNKHGGAYICVCLLAELCALQLHFGLYLAEKSPAARAEVSPLLAAEQKKKKKTPAGSEQRSFTFMLPHPWMYTVFALIYCPQTKTCD